MHKVFISYSHDSREHADRVLTLADRLIRDGVDCVLDQYEESPAEGWTRWMDQQISAAEFVLMIFTETYGKRVNGKEEPGKGLGVKWEGKLIYQHLYQADANTRFIPVVFAPEYTQFISTPLQDATYYLVSNDEGYEKLYRRLTHKPKTPKPELGKLRQLPPRERKQDFFAPKIQTAKLPTTTSTIFGREAELKLLDQAWADEHTHLLSLVAWGGVGKTALVNEWLSRLERDNFRGAERVFGWSFYSQGTREERNVSADSFFDEALRWFAKAEPVEALSPWDKGIRLAELLRQQKTLLILDGVEPLQYPPGQLQGELKDQGLKALLKELARANLGLCVVTTRVALQDISHTEGKTSRRIDLENLSPEAGSQLLRSLQVKGTDKELAAASREFGGHALALNLLGRYLTVVHEGEVRKRDLIPHLTEEEKQGGHARRVMESYERWLAGKPECDILHLMGLFDRPAAKGAIAALLAQPEIKGLTTNLQNLPLAQLQFAYQHLRDLRLLAEKDAQRPDTLDCHPLVREHFGEKLRRQNPAAWKEAHGRLYEYYKKLPAKELPDTLEEMEPLFAAVAHGCQAGRHQEALVDVFWKRIRRGNEQFSYHKLGAFGADLSALSNFFEILWRQPASGLPDDAKPFVLSWAGFALRALGRLAEASQPMQAGMEASAQKEDWKGAAQDAGNLSELYLTLGEVSQAVASARQSVDFADRSGDAFEKMKQRVKLADAMHQAGDLKEAENLFLKGETMQKAVQPAYDYLYSTRGFQFCDLLLSQGQYQEVQKRARQTLEWGSQGYTLLDFALDKLSLSRAFLLQALAEATARALGAPGQYFDQAREYLLQAVTGLRESGREDILPLGLFARAACYRAKNEFAPAWADLEEAREIAERGGMKLFLADYHLESCRLCLAQHAAVGIPGVETSRRDVSTVAISTPVGSTTDHLSNARQHLADAKELIEQMGYGRRQPEVEALQYEIMALKI